MSPVLFVVTIRNILSIEHSLQRIRKTPNPYLSVMHEILLSFFQDSEIKIQRFPSQYTMTCLLIDLHQKQETVESLAIRLQKTVSSHEGWASMQYPPKLLVMYASLPYLPNRAVVENICYGALIDSELNRYASVRAIPPAVLSSERLEREVLLSNFFHNRHQFRITSESIVASKTHTIFGYEYLIKNELPCTKTELINFGAKYGYLKNVDLYILRQAIESINTASDIHIAVNLTNTDLQDLWYQEILFDALQNLKKPQNLILEISEAAPINFATVYRFIEEIKRYGCLIAIDDFGHGYNSSDILTTIPFDILKLHKAFVQCITSESSLFFLYTQNLIKLMQGFGKRTIAEGIDSEQTAEVAYSLGVDYLQGFFFT